MWSARIFGKPTPACKFGELRFYFLKCSDLNLVLENPKRTECCKYIPLGRSWEDGAHPLVYCCEMSSLGTPDFNDPALT